MKCLTLLFSLVLMMMTHLSPAQDFAPVGAIWHYSEGFAFSGDIDYLTIQSVKDTIIQDKLCRRLDGEWVCWFPSGKQYVHYSNDSLYRYNADFDSFQLIAAFNAKRQDAWKFPMKDLDESIDTIKVEVDSVSLVTINNRALRQLYVTYYVNNYDVNGKKNRDYYYSSRIIEKIGDTHYLFNFPLLANLICDANYSDGLRCYEDADFGLYSTGIAESCTYTYDWVGIKDPINTLKLEIFPNPTYGILQLNIGDQKDLSVQVKDRSGRCLLSEMLNDTRQIDLSAFTAGLYIITVSDKQRTIGHLKVIKK